MTYQCCFCGCTINLSNEETPFISITIEDGAVQGLACHSYCLRSVLHQLVPLPTAAFVEVNVPLDDEGVDCWRPAMAVKVKEGQYLIARTNNVPTDEHWRFNPGTIVAVEPHLFAGGIERLAAVEEAKGQEE